MGWWKRFNDWLDKPRTSSLKSWTPGTPEAPYRFPTPAEAEVIPFPTSPPMQAECSDAPEGASSPDNAPAAILSTSDATRSDEGSDGKSEPGDVTTETTLEHADSLPSATFRVFPNAANHRNSYDSEVSVRRAVAARKANPEFSPGAFFPHPIKVYRAETVWRDVSADYVKPWTSLP